MMNDWKEQMKRTKQAYALFTQSNPDFVKAFGGLALANDGATELDAKSRELIALAVAATTQCDSCIASHAFKAVQAGVTREELGEALAMAIQLNAGAANVYAVKASEAFDQLSRAARPG